jgi:hypothetical protein
VRLGRREAGDQVGRAERVADAQSGQAPRLGEAADHEQSGEVPPAGQRGRLPGHGVGEGLVDQEHAARPRQRRHRTGGVQHRGGVGRVAEHDEVGVVGHGGGVEPVAVIGTEQQSLDRVSGGAQGGLGLGERRVDDDGAAWAERAGDQHEHLGGPGGEQHLALRATVRGGDGGPRRSRVGVGGRAVDGVVQDGAKPVRRSAGADVDGQVDEAGRQVVVPVVVQVHRETATVTGPCTVFPTTSSPPPTSAAASATDPVPTCAATRSDGDGTITGASSAAE